jgi:hypothetical protein
MNRVAYRAVLKFRIATPVSFIVFTVLFPKKSPTSATFLLIGTVISVSGVRNPGEEKNPPGLGTVAIKQSGASEQMKSLSPVS